MNVFIVKRNFLFLLIAFSALVSACTKIATTDIGSGLLPSVDGVNTFDTFIDVTTKNLADSFIRVNILNDHSLGYVNDPLFGNTTATVNVQLKPDHYPYKFENTNKDSLYLDSVVLVLGYKGVWGDSTQPIGLRVYEIEPENNFVHDTAYPNTYNLSRGAELTANQTAKSIDVRTLGQYIHPFKEDSLTNNQVRIKLDSSFGLKLLKVFDTLTAYKNDTLFNAYLHGFQIAPDLTGSPMMNALMRVNLLDTNTKLALYYRFTLNGKLDTTVKYFKANQYTSANCNTITRNTSGAQIANYIPKNSNPYDTLLFMAAGPGAYARIQIPNLNLLPNMIIHRAELLMDQVPDATNPSEHFLTAPNLFLAAYSTDSMRRFTVPNDVTFSSGYISNLPSFGSLPVPKSNGTETYYTYSFDLSRYLQGVVTRKEKTYDMILWAPYNDGVYYAENALLQVGISQSPLNAPACGRVRLGGGSKVPGLPHKMRFHIVYSKI